MQRNYQEIESQEALRRLLCGDGVITRCAFQSIDFSIEEAAVERIYSDCIFMGCVIPEQMINRLDNRCYIFPSIRKPFNCFPAQLYDSASLYAGYQPECEASFGDCYDTRVYRHYVGKGKISSDISEMLARALHDHSVSDSLHEMLARYDERRVVAVMGGHALLRTEDNYVKIAQISKQLTEMGYLMVSGGGPGAMEATHLGAWMAGREDDELLEAVGMLRIAPHYKDEGWLRSAFAVMEQFPCREDFCSIGMPTWFYGHEPATPFASHIAKYFDNSVREDGLLAIAKGGVIYTPGSAGTMQEIFQDAAQNHYETFGFASPMVFFGEEYWTRQVPVYELLKNLQQQGRYQNLLLSITDDIDSVVDYIISFGSAA
ncbi:MAG: hypothetical protein IIY05_01195 [Alistipes sp.]|nr:hypothetical protein [Alistipes sp.]